MIQATNATSATPTIADLRALNPKDAHDRHCEGGWIEFHDTDDHTSVMRCPHCERRGNEALLRAAVEASGIGARYFDVDWKDLETVEPLPALQHASQNITEIITSGHNALLAGPPGTGKTQAAALLVKAAIHAGHTARLENIGRVAMNIRAAYDNGGDTEADTVTRLTTTDLLVLDDIGAGEAGEAKLEKRLLYFTTEARQNARRPTILTTNLTAEEIAAFLGDRIINRLMPLEIFNFRHGRNFRAPTGSTAWRQT